MMHLALSPDMRSNESCALQRMRLEQDVPVAAQRIRPLDAAIGTEWHELLVRPVGADPGELMLHAEALGCAAEVDLIVASVGLRRARALGGRVSLNISAQSISEHGFLWRLAKVIEATGFPLSRLVLEITETAAITDPGRAIALCEWMRAGGAWIALDDLREAHPPLPLSCVDVIKADRSLVAHAQRSDAEARLLRLVTIARRAGVLTVAEGIETRHQLETVARLGFGYYQGFLHELPVLLA